MILKSCLAFSAVAVAFVVRAQSQIKVGDFDPPTLDGLKGEIGCVAYHLDSACDYVLGYVVNGPETVIVGFWAVATMVTRCGQWLRP
jgi:hypothetical protein